MPPTGRRRRGSCSVRTWGIRRRRRCGRRSSRGWGSGFEAGEGRVAQELKIGLVGLDTSHVEAFTSLLNDPKNGNHVAGGKVVAAFPGGSKDFELSWSRVEKFTKSLREKYAVEMKETPEAVAEAVDLLFITAVDGRVHRGQFERTVKFKRPTFVDKPFAVSVADAEAMVRLANAEKVPLMSCSSLRYAESLVAALGGK